MRHGAPKRVATALLCLVATLAALALSELVVRIVRPQYVQGADPINNPFWRHDPRLGWSHEPNARGMFTREEFSHPVAINSAGWRDRERARTRTTGVGRVAVLGDSFTWGHGVADGEIFTRRIEDSDPGLEVLNFGLSASATDQQLLILREHVFGYDPDLVLVMITRNDFAALRETREGSYPKPRFLLGADGALVLTNVPVPDVSTLARWHYRVRRRFGLLNLAESFVESTGREDVAPPSAGGERAGDLMRALLMTMNGELAAREIGFAVGLVPSNAHTYLTPIPPAEVRRHDDIRGIVTEAGFPVFDLVPAFRDAAIDPATGGRVDLHYYHDHHWNAAGHALAARELERLLRENQLLPVAAGGRRL